MRRRQLPPAIAGLLSAVALAASAPPAGAAPLVFGSCASLPAFSCASLPVPLDRTGSLTGTITLSLERKLAGATPTRSAVVGLAGGPGQAALPLGEFMAGAIAPALATRDLLVFDQRGTGASHPLSCGAFSPAATVHPHSLAEVALDCASELGPARGDFTTSETVEDIEALRQATGYEKLVLFGTSYGTKVALDYAERYPQHVEALVLDSTETAAGPDPFRVSTFKAMTPALDELCEHGACAGITANPVSDLARLAASLSAHPLRGRVYDRNGRSARFAMDGHSLYSLLLAGDENPILRAQMPAVVHAAVRHDPAPLLRLAALLSSTSGGEESSGVDEVLFVDTSCEETPFPWQRGATAATRMVEAEAAVNRLPAQDFYPFNAEAGLVFETLPLCASWPDAAPVPPGESPLPNVPTLILSGGQDLRTPTENALQVAAKIPDAQVLKVPYTGHSVLGSDFSGCVAAALVRFFTAAPVGGCAASRNPFPASPVPPRSLAALAPARGVPGAAGRTVTALVQTIRDMRRIVVLAGLGAGKLPTGLRLGGLRGGSVRVTKSATVLDRLVYVPGVQVDGAIPNTLLFKNKGSAANLRVAAAGGAGGQIRIMPSGHIEGVLGGRRFSTRVHASAITTSVGRSDSAITTSVGSGSAIAASVGRSGSAEWPAPLGRLPVSPLGRPR